MTDLDRLDAPSAAEALTEIERQLLEVGMELMASEMHGAIETLLAAVRERDELREAAQAVVKQADADDDPDGQYVDFLVPADAIEALRAVLHREDEA